jgi:hypothetical protein
MAIDPRLSGFSLPPLDPRLNDVPEGGEDGASATANLSGDDLIGMNGEKFFVSESALSGQPMSAQDIAHLIA